MNKNDFRYAVELSTEAESQDISNRLYASKLKQLNLPAETEIVFLNFIVKNNDDVIGGINAYVFSGVLFIDILFVEESYREKKIGTYLLQKVENEAKAQGATLSHLDTFDFQAKDFYLKTGYEIFGALENCPQGHKRYYMKKVL
jgi:GNAT superfamily N-acetyltransferase